jgi:hypothetical protein
MKFGDADEDVDARDTTAAPMQETNAEDDEQRGRRR